MIEQNDMIHDIEVEVHQERIIITKLTAHKTFTALYLEIILVMTKVLLLHITLDHDMTILKDTRDLIALFINPHTNQLIDVTLITEIDHVHILEMTILHDTHCPVDL